MNKILLWLKRIGLALLIFSILYLHVENLRLMKFIDQQHMIIAYNELQIANFLELMEKEICKEHPI